MRRSFFILLLLLCSPVISMAQASTTVYYGKYWEETKEKRAEWYCIYTYQNGLYKIEEHYIDGPMYKTGYCTAYEPNSVAYRTGPIVFYDVKGNKLREGEYKNGIRTGIWKHYYTNSEALRIEEKYKGDSVESPEYSLHFDSATHKLVRKIVYASKDKTLNWEYSKGDSTYFEVTNSKSGDTNIITSFFKDYSIVKKENLKDPKNDIINCYNAKGEVISCPNADKISGSGKIFTYVEQMPKESVSMKDHLAHNLHYPSLARNKNIEGRVVVKFVVDEDGAVACPMIVKGIGGGCDEEALRVISEMPCWEPALQNGIPVRVYFTLPIQFKLK